MNAPLTPQPSLSRVLMRVGPTPTRSRSATSRLARAAGDTSRFHVRTAMAAVAPLTTASRITAPVRFSPHPFRTKIVPAVDRALTASIVPELPAAAHERVGLDGPRSARGRRVDIERLQCAERGIHRGAAPRGGGWRAVPPAPGFRRGAVRSECATTITDAGASVTAVATRTGASAVDATDPQDRMAAIRSDEAVMDIIVCLRCYLSFVGGRFGAPCTQ